MLKPVLGFDFGAFPIYQLCLLCAFFAALIMQNRAMKTAGFSKYVKRRVRRSFTLGSICGLLGANIANWFLFEGVLDLSVYHRLTQGGFTFYFGMLSFFAVSALALRLYKVDVRYNLNMVIPAVLLAQSIGRLGCSLRGCCYGATVTLFDKQFLLPARELEAVFALTLCIVLASSKRGFVKRFPLYLFSYSCLRFVLEFARGDNRGAIGGIAALSPTQIVCLPVIAVSAAVLFARPLLRCFKREAWLDNARARCAAVWASTCAKLHPKTGYVPYAALPFDYVPVKRPKKALKIVLSTVSILLVLCFVFVYTNPLRIVGLDDAQYALKDAFGFLYEQKGTETELGVTNGVSLLDVSDRAIMVKSEGDALSLIRSCDEWATFQYTCTATKRLAGGKLCYEITQVVGGKPVLGATRVLVVSEDDHAQYIVGDDAALSYTSKVDKSYTLNTMTVAEAFGKSVTVLERMTCWYDTGDGLVNAQHVVLTDDGKTPVLGAVLKAETGQIIRCTAPALGRLSSVEAYRTEGAFDSVKHFVDTGDEAALKTFGKKQKRESETEQDRVQTMRALSLAYQYTDVTTEQYGAILDSAEAVMSSAANPNGDLLREVMKQETHDFLLSEGYSEKQATAAAKQIDKAFDKAGIDCREDEVATAVETQERKTTFRHSIDFDNDADVFRIDREAGLMTNVTFDADEPLYVEVYTADGDPVVSFYLGEKQTLPLYPEDGDAFIIRVSNRNGTLMYGAVDYQIDMESVEVGDDVPKHIRRVMNKIASSYQNSELVTFTRLWQVEDRQASVGEALVVGVFAPIMDSCMSSCVMFRDDIDSAKGLIVGSLGSRGGNLDGLPEEVSTLRGTTLQLTYVSHIEKEDYTAVKLHMSVCNGDMEMLEGHSFIKLEPSNDTTEYDTSALGIFGWLTAEPYIITEVNTDELYALFGDTPDHIHTAQDMTSLYDLCADETIDMNGMSFTVQRLDTEAAMRAGHPAEKITTFELFLARRNLSDLTVEKRMLEQEVARMAVIEPLYNLAEFAMDPLGYLFDETFAQNEVTDALWRVAKLIADPDSAVMDELQDAVLDEMFASLKDDIARKTVKIEVLARAIELYEDRIRELKAMV